MIIRYYNRIYQRFHGVGITSRGFKGRGGGSYMNVDGAFLPAYGINFRNMQRNLDPSDGGDLVSFETSLELGVWLTSPTDVCQKDIFTY